MTATVKAAVEGAFLKLGGQKWLIEQAKSNPEAFMTLLGKVLPREMALDVAHGVTVVVRDYTGRGSIPTDSVETRAVAGFVDMEASRPPAGLPESSDHSRAEPV
jgi:hypothetical protein